MNYIHAKREVNGAIVSCSVSEASAFGSRVGQLKETIIWNINKGISYYTFYDNHLGSLVKVIQNRYIRTDANNIPGDNLDNLPDY